VVVDHSLKNQTADGALAKAKLQKGNIYTLLDKVRVKRDLLPAMIQGAERIAAGEMEALVASALVTMRSKLQSEIDRLEDLSMLNNHVRPEEISGLKNQMAALEEAISGTRLRLDALRMIWRKADRGRDVR
jgi:ATP-dependent helicase HepA